jgi:type IV pilus assembly protein PilO
MDLKMNLDMKSISATAKYAAVSAVLVIAAIVAFVSLIMPKQKEIERLKTEITKQENEIARDQAKAAKLSILMAENEKLKRRLEELKIQLPEEREVSGLLKQVSDLGLKSGMKTLLWKPEQKRDHPSGIVYETPVSVELHGGYHNLGVLFSSLTKLNRIVNVNDIKLGSAKYDRGSALLKVTFKATTFSAVPESELASKKAPDGKKEKAAPWRKP